MPSRYSQLDSDEERLPEGVVRIGYDADTQIYTFRDADGSIWEGAPGVGYGRLTKIADAPTPPSKPPTTDLDNVDVEDQAPPPYDYDYDRADDSSRPFLGGDADQQERRRRLELAAAMGRSWRAELMPLLNFFFVIALFLLGVFWFLGYMARSHRAGGGGGGGAEMCGVGTHRHVISAGETCWAVAERHKCPLDMLRAANEDINCDDLQVGQVVCVPGMPM